MAISLAKSAPRAPQEFLGSALDTGSSLACPQSVKWHEWFFFHLHAKGQFMEMGFERPYWSISPINEYNGQRSQVLISLNINIYKVAIVFITCFFFSDIDQSGQLCYLICTCPFIVLDSCPHKQTLCHKKVKKNDNFFSELYDFSDNIV